MTPQKKGLGRGLDALLDPYSIDLTMEEPETESGRRVLSVPIHSIDTNREQPRKQFDEDALQELCESIKVHGIVQPLIVTARKDRYMIIAGERRFRAARMAGLTEVPVLVADYDEAEIHEVSLIENIQREDLNPIEEAAAISFLMKQHDMTQEEVSARIGKSRPAVANSLRLLSLPERVTALVKEGKLSAGHGRALAGVDDAETIEKLADETIRMGYSVRALESRVKNLAEKKPRKEKPAPQLSPDLRNVEDTFRERLGTRVKIAGDERKGRITIDYYSREDLERVFSLLIHG